MKPDLDAVYRDRLDVLFANRNRAYGAYQLRRTYAVTLGRALAFGLGLVALSLALPYVLNAVSGRAALEPPPYDVIAELQPLRDVAPTPPPPPPPVLEPPPPARATDRFVPPVVVDDTEEETPPPAMEELAASPKDVDKDASEGDPGAMPTLDEFDRQELAVETQAAPAPDENIYNEFDIHKKPSFPGGEYELMKYLAENIQYPPLARENGIQGTVVLSFLIGKDGSVSDVQILKDQGGGTAREAVRVVKAMPRWLPGEANGHPVKVRFTLPVRFKLN